MFESSVHPAQHSVQVAQISGQFALGPARQQPRGMLAIAFLQAVDEQTRVLGHVFALCALGAPVMREPGMEVARGQPIGMYAVQQGAGMGRVGARQRCEDARGRPARYLRRAHRLQQVLGQCTQQHQTPADPAHIAPTLLGRLALAQSVGVDQLAQQQRFLDRGERARHRVRQHLCQRLVQRATPTLHQRRVAPQARQRLYAPITIDQHQRGAAGLGRGNARHQLPILVNRVGQPLHRPRVHDAHAGKAQLQAVQIDLHRHSLGVRARALRASWLNNGTIREIGHAQFLQTKPAKVPGALRDAQSRGESHRPM